MKACDNDNRTSNKIKLFLTHLNGDVIVSKWRFMTVFCYLN